MAHKGYIVVGNGVYNQEDLGWDFARGMNKIWVDRVIDQDEDGIRLRRTYDIDDIAVRMLVAQGSASVRIIGRPRKLDAIKAKIEKETKFRLEEMK